jgi:hypothetical protein
MLGTRKVIWSTIGFPHLLNLDWSIGSLDLSSSRASGTSEKQCVSRAL